MNGGRARLTPTTDGVLLNLHVIPGSSVDRLTYEGISCMLRVHVKAPAHEGKANGRLLKVLRKTFGVCEIVSGHKSKDKVILIKNASENDILNKIQQLGDR